MKPLGAGRRHEVHVPGFGYQKAAPPPGAPGETVPLRNDGVGEDNQLYFVDTGPGAASSKTNLHVVMQKTHTSLIKVCTPSTRYSPTQPSSQVTH
tara:strand:+ start:1185 stop:1469 length:285 start_codon:yes stop_codon:yes gene_type:complete